MFGENYVQDSSSRLTAKESQFVNKYGNNDNTGSVNNSTKQHK